MFKRIINDTDTAMIATYKGTVENGQVRLSDNVQLPEHAVVYVLLPDQSVVATASIATPRLRDPQQASDFTMDVAEERSDDSV